jgi:hypothetical protein
MLRTVVATRYVTAFREGGPIGALPQPERYRWLTVPSSTVIQPSKAHTGLAADPAATLGHLFATLVLAPQPVDPREGGTT